MKGNALLLTTAQIIRTSLLNIDPHVLHKNAESDSIMHTWTAESCKSLKETYSFRYIQFACDDCQAMCMS